MPETSPALPAGIERREIAVADTTASFLTAGEGPTLLLLHGTYWSRVWLPVLDRLAAAGLNLVAVDLPGLGRSGGELTLETATVPALAEWVARFVDTLAPTEVAGVVGHDIGGAVTQHLAVAEPTVGAALSRYALANSVTYDSWPVPGVARFRDPEVAAATSVEEILDARRVAVRTALHREATEAEIADYLGPWHDARVARSWMALAGAADSRYTEELMDRLRADRRPKLLVWGAEDTFQPLPYAERFAQEVPGVQLEVVAGAGHIPMENDAPRVAAILAHFFTAAPTRAA